MVLGRTWVSSGLRTSPASDRLAPRFLRWGVPPPRLQRPAFRIRPLTAVGPARGLDFEIYEISEKWCPVSILAHNLLTTYRAYLSACFFTYSTYVFSDLRPMGGGRLRTLPASPLWRPAQEAVCSNLGENWHAPRTHATQVASRAVVDKKLFPREKRELCTPKVRM